MAKFSSANDITYVPVWVRPVGVGVLFLVAAGMVQICGDGISESLSHQDEKKGFDREPTKEDAFLAPSGGEKSNKVKQQPITPAYCQAQGKIFTVTPFGPACVGDNQ